MKISFFTTLIAVTLSLPMSAHPESLSPGSDETYRCYQIFSETVKFSDIGTTRILGAHQKATIGYNMFDITVDSNEIRINGHRRERRKTIVASKSNGGFQYIYNAEITSSLRYTTMFSLLEVNDVKTKAAIPSVHEDKFFKDKQLKYILQASTNELGLYGPYIVAETYKCVRL
jgi:hypothetical protein